MSPTGVMSDELTEEERQAALELAEKLRRRANSLKRRRRTRERLLAPSHSDSIGFEDYSHEHHHQVGFSGAYQ